MRYIKPFNESKDSDIELIEDYIIPLLDDGFVYITAQHYGQDGITLRYRSNPFNFNESNWKKVREEIENEMSKIELDLFTSSKRIIKNAKAFGYSTFIGLSDFNTSARREHIRGYIENNSKFIGYFSQENQIIPKVNFINASAIGESLIKFRNLWGNTFYIWVEIRINGFKP